MGKQRDSYTLEQKRQILDEAGKAESYKAFIEKYNSENNTRLTGPMLSRWKRKLKEHDADAARDSATDRWFDARHKVLSILDCLANNRADLAKEFLHDLEEETNRACTCTEQFLLAIKQVVDDGWLAMENVHEPDNTLQKKIQGETDCESRIHVMRNLASLRHRSTKEGFGHQAAGVFIDWLKDRYGMREREKEDLRIGIYSGSCSGDIIRSLRQTDDWSREWGFSLKRSNIRRVMVYSLNASYVSPQRLINDANLLAIELASAFSHNYDRDTENDNAFAEAYGITSTVEVKGLAGLQQLDADHYRQKLLDVIDPGRVQGENVEKGPNPPELPTRLDAIIMGVGAPPLDSSQQEADPTTLIGERATYLADDQSGETIMDMLRKLKPIGDLSFTLFDNTYVPIAQESCKFLFYTLIRVGVIRTMAADPKKLVLMAAHSKGSLGMKKVPMILAALGIGHAKENGKRKGYINRLVIDEELAMELNRVLKTDELRAILR